MRTAADAFADMSAKGRTPEQIRCVALARNDLELIALCEERGTRGGAYAPQERAAPDTTGGGCATQGQEQPAAQPEPAAPQAGGLVPAQANPHGVYEESPACAVEHKQSFSKKGVAEFSIVSVFCPDGKWRYSHSFRLPTSGAGGGASDCDLPWETEPAAYAAGLRHLLRWLEGERDDKTGLAAKMRTFAKNELDRLAGRTQPGAAGPQGRYIARKTANISLMQLKLW